MDKIEKNSILISYADENINNEIDSFKRQVQKRDIIAIETNDGIIEAKINAAGPENIKDYLDQTIYVAVFIISAYFAGFIGEAGAERYKKLTYQIGKFVSKLKSSKDALFIVQIERDKNFVLKLCFVINKKCAKEKITQALNLVPIAVKTIKQKISQYENEKVLLINYENNNWNLNNIKSLKINYGTTILANNRILKNYGICEAKYFPDNIRNTQSEWEYLNEEPPEEAYKNALKYTIDYYERLYSAKDIEHALHFRMPVSVSFEMYESFLNAPNGNIPIPAPGERKITGHCVTIIGYNQNRFIFRNSWGRNWGNNGKGILPYEYIDKYMIESWSMMTFIKFRKIFTFRKIFKLRRIFNINFWKKYYQYKKMKGISRCGQFTDKANRKIKYEIYGCQSRKTSNRGIVVVDLFNPNVRNKKSGWGIFSIKNNNNLIEIEDIFIEDDYSNSGWGTEIISIFEKFISKWNQKKIQGWINVVDSNNEFSETRIKNFFQKNDFSIIKDSSKFPGAKYKVEKILNNKI